MAATWLLKAKHKTKETDADAITTNDDSDWNRAYSDVVVLVFDVYYWDVPICPI